MKVLQMLPTREVRAVLSGLALASLVACGGGGGGDNVRPPSPPPAAPPPDPVVLAPNPAYSRHLALTNTAPAHAAGYTGQGIRIGVIDTGVNRNHPALQGRVVGNLTYVSSPPNNLAVDDVVGHGTGVSQIMAGTPFGAWPGGIAPGALIVSARIIADESPDDDGSGQGNEVTGAVGLKPIHQDLINRGVRIMNNSWGGLYWTDPGATAPIADEYRPFVISNGGLVVFATGNSSFPDPSSMAALPSQPGTGGSMPAADLERGWLAVAALDTSKPTQLATYSNACGVAMDYCLVAPGTVTVTGTEDGPTSPTYWNWSGTSLAAPQVSGAAALVWEAFPYFDNDLVRQTILGTAADLGAAGVDPVFGHGLLDVGAAVNGPARLDWGDVSASFNGATSVWANAISGSGGLIKDGTGRLELSRLNSYSGLTSVLGGTLSSAFTVPGDARVGAAGNLELLSGVLGDLDNEGTVTSLGAGSHQIGGDYRQSAAARLAFEVGAPLEVAGHAQIDGDARVLGIASGYTQSAQETVLTAAGGLDGTFATLSSGPGVFLDASLGYDATTAWLDIVRLDVTATAQAMGISAMSVASARRIEDTFRAIDRGNPADPAGPFTAEFLRAAGAFQRVGTVAAAAQSLDSLSGELHGADTALVLMEIEASRHALESRLDGLRLASVTGAWGDALGGQRAISQFDVDASGWMLGHDRGLGERWTLGAAFGQSDAYAHHALRGDRERSRQLEGQLYAQWQHGGDYLLGRFAVGRMQRQTQREILLGLSDFGVGVDYASRYATLGLQAGHRFDAAGATFTPYVGVQALQLDRDGFAEQGAAGFGLSTTGSATSATQAMLGARVERQWDVAGVRVAAHGRAEWQRTLAQSGADIDARFTAVDVWSPIIGPALARDVGVLGFGVSARLPRWGRLSLDLDGRHDRGRTDAQAFARWSLPF